MGILNNQIKSIDIGRIEGSIYYFQVVSYNLFEVQFIQV